MTLTPSASVRWLLRQLHAALFGPSELRLRHRATREAAKRGVKPNGTPIKRRRPCQWCGGDHLDSECKQSRGKRPKGTAAEDPASKPGDLSAHKSDKPEGKPSGKGKGTKAVSFAKRDREPLSDPDLEAAFQEGKCFVCGEKGHVSRHCPNK